MSVPERGFSEPSAAAVIFVDDVATITAFYQALVGMTLVHADHVHAVLEVANFQLTVHALTPPAGGVPASYPTREDACVKLCFPVQSLAHARAVAATVGGEVWAVDREWQARGFRACDGRDPEGNVFQLRERVP